jgi:beta-lactam-binding protein with PASTA domain
VLSAGGAPRPYPPLDGKATDVAAALRAAGFEVKLTQSPTEDETQFGMVVGSNVTVVDSDGDGRAAAGSLFELKVGVGTGKVPVPDVVGQDRAAASAAIAAAGLAADVRTKPSDQPAGSVIATGPAARTEVPQGAAVTLMVSNGQAITVPTVPATTVPGSPPTQPTTTKASNPSNPSSSILGTTPPTANATPAPTVKVTSAPSVVTTTTAAPINSAPPQVTIPSIEGMTQAQAQATLTSAGLTSTVTMVTATAASHLGKVVSIGNLSTIDPDNNRKVPPGTSVNLRVGLGETIPSVVGQSSSSARSMLSVFTVNESITPTREEAGEAISTSPAAGSVTYAGAPVTINVAGGFPTVTGAMWYYAKSQIEGLGLTFSDGGSCNDTYFRVYYVSVQPGAATTLGQSVYVECSDGSGHLP